MVILLKIAIVARNVILDFINLKEKPMTKKEKEIIETIERARLRLEQSLNFYYKNTKNENIKNYFWANIGLEINDVKNELMDLKTKLIVFLEKRYCCQKCYIRFYKFKGETND